MTTVLDANEQYELAINAAQLPVWEYDIPNNRVSGNVHWHRALGYELTEAQAALRSETWLNGIHPDDVAGFERVYSSEIADSTGFFETEFRMQTADGSYKWLLDRGRVVERDALGVPIRVVGISVDIDARKRSEEAVRHSELRFRSVIEAAPVPFALNDDQGNVRFLNSTCIRTFGYLISDIPTLADWWLRAYPDPVYRQWVKETWAGRLERALQTGGPFEAMEVIIRCKDGSDRTVLAYAARLAGNPTPDHLVILLDVTEHRILEQKILTAVSREQHRIGMDLHDGLGQQLTGLSLMLAALARSVQSGDQISSSRELEALATMAGDCVTTTRAIAHGLSPIESGSGNFERALRRLADSTQKTTSLSVTLSLIEIRRLDLEQAVAGPLFRIIQEALSNAAKHSHATQVRIRVHHVAGILKLTVTDNGRGFCKEQVAEGLGLSIMRYRARALGGRVEIGRAKNGGTIVRCTCRVESHNGFVAAKAG